MYKMHVFYFVKIYKMHKKNNEKHYDKKTMFQNGLKF